VRGFLVSVLPVSASWKPFPAAESGDRLASAARYDDPQIPVEHKKGFTNRIDYGLRQQRCVFGTLKRFERSLSNHDLTCIDSGDCALPPPNTTKDGVRVL
jgi:hypothetical protein